MRFSQIKFPKADPEVKIHVQVIYKGGAPGRKYKEVIKQDKSAKQGAISEKDPVKSDSRGK